MTVIHILIGMFNSNPMIPQSGFIQEAAYQIREHSRVFEDYFREHFENIYMIKFRR